MAGNEEKQESLDEGKRGESRAIDDIASGICFKNKHKGGYWIA